MLRFKLNLQNVELVGLGIESTRDSDFLTLKTMHQVRSIEPENIFSYGKDEITSQVLDAVHGACIGGSAHGLGLKHFLM